MTPGGTGGVGGVGGSDGESGRSIGDARNHEPAGASRGNSVGLVTTKRPVGRVEKRINAFWREYGYHHGQVRLRNQPSVLAVESTNHCNLRCVMCPRGEPDVMERSVGTMTDAVFDRVLDEARFFEDPCWFHWFGEPLMHPRLFDQIERAKAHGVPNLGISTNGTLLDARRREAILASPLDTVMIAIDGTTKEVYERIRLSPRHEFEEVVENARSFLAAKRTLGRRTPHTILSIIVMQETAEQLGEFRSFWLDAGADEVLFKPFTTWGSQTDDFVRLTPRAEREAEREADQAAERAGRAHPCSLLWESLVIAWNGLVVPCCYDYDAKEAVGDITRQSLAEIWNGEAYQRLRRAERDGVNDSPLCAGCTEAPGRPRNPRWPLPF